MVSLFRAEWNKITGNRWVVGFLVWVFPVGALAFLTIMGVMLAVVPNARDDAGVQELGLNDASWTEAAVQAWSIPNSLLGRLLLLGFASVVFGGEYQWRTWKNIVPHSQRTRLILAKFLAVAVMVLITFVIMSIVITIGVGILAAMVGESYGPPPSGPVLAEFAGDYAQQMWLSFTLTIIAAGYALLAGMVTRSILGGALVGAVSTYIEGLSIFLLVLIAHFSGFREIVELYRLTPSYNVANVRSWINVGGPPSDGVDAELLRDYFQYADSLEYSLLVLALWVIGLVGCTVYLFRKQDII